MDRDGRLDTQIRRRMCSLSTKQKPTEESHPRVSNPSTSRRSTFRSDRDGPDHPTTSEQRIRRHPDHCRSWMYSCSLVSPVQNNDYRGRNSLAILRQCLPLVRITPTHHLRPRSPLYLIIRHRTGKSDTSDAKSQYSLPPSNGRTHRAKEPVDRTISQTVRSQHPRRLGQMADNSNRRP
jgi:hypothetical protein